MASQNKTLASDLILLVEDNPDHVELVQRMFETHHVPNLIRHLVDGEAALEYLFRQKAYADPATSPRPCLVLLDLWLPKMDGLEVLKRVKESQELQNLPVIILSTSEVKGDVDQAYALGANGYLMKPLEPHQFSQVIHHLGKYWLKWNRLPGQIG